MRIPNLRYKSKAESQAFFSSLASTELCLPMAETGMTYYVVSSIATCKTRCEKSLLRNVNFVACKRSSGFGCLQPVCMPQMPWPLVPCESSISLPDTLTLGALPLFKVQATSNGINMQCFSLLAFYDEDLNA